MFFVYILFIYFIIISFFILFYFILFYFFVLFLMIRDTTDNFFLIIPHSSSDSIQMPYLF